MTCSIWKEELVNSVRNAVTEIIVINYMEKVA